MALTPSCSCFESSEFHTQVERLREAGLLYQVTERFADIDLHPDNVDNIQMGTIFEELIRKGDKGGLKTFAEGIETISAYLDLDVWDENAIENRAAWLDRRDLKYGYLG